MEFNHTFIVVNNSSVNLFGRDLIHKFKMQVVIPDNIGTVHKLSEDILKKFNAYLSDSFQSCVKQEVTFIVHDVAKPVFTRARPVPLRLKEAVKTEIDRLVNEGKMYKVYDSDWALPIVAVLKKGGKSVRNCGDYGAVNSYLRPVNAPLISIDEVISQVGDAVIY